MYSKEITFETNEQVPTTFIFYKNSYSVNLVLLRPLIQELVEKMKNKNNETIILFQPPQLLIFKIFPPPPPPSLFIPFIPTLPSFRYYKVLFLTKTFNLTIIFLNAFLKN